MADRQQQSIHLGTPTIWRIIELEETCARLEQEKAYLVGIIMDALAIVGDRAAGGRMITPIGVAKKVSAQMSAVLAKHSKK